MCAGDDLMVESVVQRAPFGTAGLQAFGHIDRPQQGTRVEGAAFDLVGWVVGTVNRVVSVELAEAGTAFRRVPVHVDRPDVAFAYPDAPGAAKSGFSVLLPAVGLNLLEVEVRAVLSTSERLSVGTVTLRRAVGSAARGVPLVSVIIPCFNQAHYLSEAIESVLRQTHPHLEIVVIDDGSSDNTAEVARRYPGVRLIQQANRGLVEARRVGFESSKGDYLVFLDADDTLLPHALSAGLEVLESDPRCDLAVGRFQHVDCDTKPLPTPGWEEPDDGQFAALLRRNYIGTPAAAMHRRNSYERIGGFREPSATADYDLYLRTATQQVIRAHPTLVANYRQHGSSMSRDPAQMLSCALSVLRKQRSAARRAGLSYAYQEGMRFWRRYYGDAVLDSILAHRAVGEQKAARLATRRLLRCDPMACLRLAVGLQPSWRPGRHRRLPRAGAPRRKASAGGAVVLLYHRIGEQDQDPWRLTVRPERFAEHLKALRSVAEPISLAEVRAGWKVDTDWLRVAVTFDDGYADNLLVAKPLLERYEVPATVFVATGYIDSPLPFWWDELAALLLGPSVGERLVLTIDGREYKWKLDPDQRDARRTFFGEVWAALAQANQTERAAALASIRRWVGSVSIPQDARPLTVGELRRLVNGGLVDVGAHTVTHPRLSCLPHIEQEREIHDSKVTLEGLLQRPVLDFAYPCGGPSDYTPATTSIVEQLGFRQAFASQDHRAVTRFSLPRMHVEDCTTEELITQLRRFAHRSSVWA